jgi:exodeoxyribonuclease VII large subunit
MNEPRLNIPEWTVSELSAALKRTVEDNFGYVRVRGEISGYRGPHSSGHCYFALKDESAKIDGVIWRGVFNRIRFKPEEGMEVIATGRLTTYPGKSAYQIVIESLEPAGVGALMALLEQRKKKLAAEGLFDEARKQLLPYLPDVIGVVTSPTGAVIRDILHRLADRFPRRVLVWPVRVQGDGAAEEVAAAIRGFNALPENGSMPRPDLLIVARGGGSIEDLWSFNEEVVVRAAAESMIPLISAVGHETDITLIDFVADRRAPTPTAAAEMAVPVRAELAAEVASLGGRAFACLQRGLDARRTELRAAVRALPTLDELVGIPRQRLDAAGDRLPRALKANAQLHHTALSRIGSRLTPHTLRARMRAERERIDAAGRRAAQCLRVQVERRRDRLNVAGGRPLPALLAMLDRCGARLERAEGLLRALSYREVLARGFALVRDAAGLPLRSAAGVTPGAALDIEFADGRVGAVASGTPRATPALQPFRRSRRPRTPDENQGNLF